MGVLPRSRKRLLVSLLVLGSLFGILDAEATSRTASLRRKDRLAPPPVCAVNARFLQAQEKTGKVVWIFERTGTEALAPACDGLSRAFEVWIWPGRFSKLTASFVYPSSITEASSGTEFDLRLEKRTVRESATSAGGESIEINGWFPASGESLKARAP